MRARGRRTAAAGRSRRRPGRACARPSESGPSGRHPSGGGLPRRWRPSSRARRRARSRPRGGAPLGQAGSRRRRGRKSWPSSAALARHVEPPGWYEIVTCAVDRPGRPPEHLFLQPPPHSQRWSLERVTGLCVVFGTLREGAATQQTCGWDPRRFITSGAPFSRFSSASLVSAARFAMSHIFISLDRSCTVVDTVSTQNGYKGSRNGRFLPPSRTERGPVGLAAPGCVPRGGQLALLPSGRRTRCGTECSRELGQGGLHEVPGPRRVRGARAGGA